MALLGRQVRQWTQQQQRKALSGVFDWEMELTWPIIGFCGLTTAVWKITDSSNHSTGIVVGLIGFVLLPVVILISRRRRPPTPVAPPPTPRPSSPGPEPVFTTGGSSRVPLRDYPDDLGADDLIAAWSRSEDPAPLDVCSPDEY